MLSKCANPNCSNTFRYLHEGKLYLIECGSATRNRSGSAKATRSRVPEYAWLCSSCCRHLIIRIDKEFGVIVIRKSVSCSRSDSGSFS
jgi:hypothetical protein